ncbi:MAG TPA: lysophospholipid acyltransferase family protein [Candidatus Obscuribacterales bacterium]
MEQLVRRRGNRLYLGNALHEDRMGTLVDKAFTWLFAVYFVISCCICFSIATIITFVTRPFDKNRRLTHYFSCIWGYHYLFVNPGWGCTIEGREHIDPRKTYILIANHQSYFDILVLYGLMRPFKFVSKESVFKTPLIGWNMYYNQYVSIKRGNLASIKEMMSDCREWLKRGASIMMFPEGTRSEDGELQSFRSGSFNLSQECNIPVVPIVIDGTHEILPKHAKGLRAGQKVRVKILPPVDPALFPGAPGKMRDHVHNLMQETLREMRSKRGRAIKSEAPEKVKAVGERQ